MAGSEDSSSNCSTGGKIGCGAAACGVRSQHRSPRQSKWGLKFDEFDISELQQQYHHWSAISCDDSFLTMPKNITIFEVNMLQISPLSCHFSSSCNCDGGWKESVAKQKFQWLCFNNRRPTPHLWMKFDQITKISFLMSYELCLNGRIWGRPCTLQHLMMIWIWQSCCCSQEPTSRPKTMSVERWHLPQPNRSVKKKKRRKKVSLTREI